MAIAKTTRLHLIVKSAVLLIICLILLPVHHLNAQSVTGYGIKAGLNQGDFRNSRFDTQPRTSLNAGIFLQIGFDRLPLTIQPEINYTRRGAQTTKIFGDIGYKGTYRTDYIEVPVLMKYNLGTPMNIHTNLYTGPYAAILVRSDLRGDASLDLEDNTRTLDAGVAAGIGFEFQNRFRPITLDLRYIHGFFDVYGPEGRWGGGDNWFTVQPPERHSLFSISIGYRFGGRGSGL